MLVLDLHLGLEVSKYLWRDTGTTLSEGLRANDGFHLLTKSRANAKHDGSV